MDLQGIVESSSSDIHATLNLDLNVVCMYVCMFVYGHVCVCTKQVTDANKFREALKEAFDRLEGFGEFQELSQIRYTGTFATPK